MFMYRFVVYVERGLLSVTRVIYTCLLVREFTDCTPRLYSEGCSNTSFVAGSPRSVSLIHMF